jgi:hypothetical protein
MLLQTPRETTRIRSQDSQCPGRYSNLEPSGYKSKYSETGTSFVHGAILSRLLTRGRRQSPLSETLYIYGRAIVQAVSRWLPTAATRVQNRV